MVRMWRTPEWPPAEANVGTTRYVQDRVSGEIEVRDEHVEALKGCGFVTLDHPQAVAARALRGG
jgi:hypothetical protein